MKAWKLLVTLLAAWAVLMAAAFAYNLPAWCAKPETRGPVSLLCPAP